MDALAKMVKRPCYGGISPRRTARRLTPILEAQARERGSGEQRLWIELNKPTPGQAGAQPRSDSDLSATTATACTRAAANTSNHAAGQH